MSKYHPTLAIYLLLVLSLGSACRHALAVGRPDKGAQTQLFVSARPPTYPQLDTALVDDSDECLRLQNKMDALGSGPYQMSYDTGRAYLLTCADVMKDVGTTFSQVGQFNDLRNNQLTRYVEYREWLKSVLYYRTNDFWYCGDASELMLAMTLVPGRSPGADGGGQIAIARYLLSTGRCHRDSMFLARSIKEARAWQIMIWRDTVRDSIHYPIPDTTVPTIDELGLGLLRGPSAVANSLRMEPRLSMARASQNPFENTTAILFRTGEYTLVKLEIFDALGNIVGGNRIGQVLEAGDHRFEFDGSKLAAGTYYARLSCLSGEHMSVKLVKE